MQLVEQVFVVFKTRGMNIKNAILGGHGWQVWLAALVWTLVGIIIVKVFYYNRKVKFNLKYWINDNIKDVALGFLFCLIMLRLGDGAIHILEERFQYDVPFDTDDFVGVLLILSIFLQNRLHKKRTPIINNDGE